MDHRIRRLWKTWEPSVDSPAGWKRPNLIGGKSRNVDARENDPIP